MRYWLLLIFSPLSLAWGFQGHRLIAHLAYPQLTPSTKQAIHHLIGGGEQRFVDTSTLADRIRPRYQHWHFATLRYPNSLPKAKGGQLYTALHVCTEILSDPQPPKGALSKPMALALLIHLVGDAHQPLHVGQGRDHGGNTVWIKVTGRKETLHHFWDTTLVKYLSQHPNTFRQVTGSTIHHTMLTWLQHSRQLHPLIYPKNRHCRRKKPCTLTTNYLRSQAPLASQQIHQAAYELAWLLNNIYSASAASKG